MKFAIFAREGISRRSRRALIVALQNVKRSLREHDIQIDKALADPRLSNESKRFIERLWYGKPEGRALSMGNRRVHRAATIAAIIVMLIVAQNEEGARKGRRRVRMLTTAPDLGICTYTAPELNLGALGRHFDQACRAANVDALGFTDIAIVDDRASLQPAKIAFHMHGAVRAIDRSFRARVAQRLASPKRQPRNQFGLRVTKITAKRRDWGKAMSRDHIAGLGYYIAKRSCGLKVILMDTGRRTSKTTLQGWSVVQALRQLECYSHCDVFQTTRGVGAGRHWRAQWKRIVLRMLQVSGAARGLKIDHEALQRNWARIWLELVTPEMTALRLLDAPSERNA